jgi:hypothetical protein
MGKEGIMPCGMKYQSSNIVSNVGDRDNSGWMMGFQHSNDIMQVEAPSSTTVQFFFYVNDFLAYTIAI